MVCRLIPAEKCQGKTTPLSAAFRGGVSLGPEDQGHTNNRYTSGAAARRRNGGAAFISPGKWRDLGLAKTSES
jgi:hypothetical protein